MDSRRLEVFSFVYSERSFSKAAQALCLTQPTVSAHISELEQYLGTRLFDRLPRKIVPTAAARTLYTYTQQIQGLLKEAEASVWALENRIVGQLLLGGSTIPAEYLLPDLLGHFVQRYPEVRLDLQVGDSRTITEAVRTGELEAGVVGGRYSESELAYSPYIKDELLVLAGRDTDVAKSGPLSMDQLSRLPWVLRESGSGTRRALRHALKKCGLRLEDLSVRAVLGSTGALLRAVRGGVGVTVSSRLAAAGMLDRGELVHIPVPEFVSERDFELVVHRGRSQSPILQRFIACVVRSGEDNAHE